MEAARLSLLLLSLLSSHANASQRHSPALCRDRLARELEESTRVIG